MDFLIQIDTDTLLAVNSWHTDFLDPIMKTFSHRTTWVLLYVAIAWVMVRTYGWRYGIAAIALVAVAVGLSDYICATGIRPYVERMRPSNLDNPISAMVHVVDGYRSGRYGFPSCHGANTLALALSSSLLLRSRGYILFIFGWALLQCYSRMYLGVHYPGDLLVGGLIGMAIAAAAYFGCSYFVDFKSHYTKTTAAPVYITGAALCVWIIVRSLLYP